MVEEIKEELLRLEKEQDIKILYAVESGSRAWGFASTDSDWDVRYIYVHKTDWYLSVEERKDSHEEILPNDIDLSGWELRKALLLFKKSNPPMLEWLNSPIVYKEDYTTAQALRGMLQAYFRPKSCIYHYLHMARKNYSQYILKDTVRHKKYFYVLRPVLACRWIEEKGTMAPVEFDVLLNEYLPNGPIRDEVNKLLIKKTAGGEMDEGAPIALLNDYLAEWITYYTEHVKDVDNTYSPGYEQLNELLRQTLKTVWAEEPMG